MPFTRMARYGTVTGPAAFREMLPGRACGCKPIFCGRIRGCEPYKGCTKNEEKICQKGIDIRPLKRYYSQAVATDRALRKGRKQE